MLSSTDTDISVMIRGKKICNSSENKLLCVKFDNKLNLEEHVSNLCKKESQKIHPLTRI